LFYLLLPLVSVRTQHRRSPLFCVSPDAYDVVALVVMRLAVQGLCDCDSSRLVERPHGDPTNPYTAQPGHDRM